jgi:predicted Zn-ribbon and HTH transcriptional regulator
MVRESGVEDSPQTIRQRMAELMEEKEMTARDLSRALGIREKAVYEHLPHLARSVSARNKKLIILPFQCLACGYLFKERNRYSPPGRCPRCKKAHVQRPLYRIR